MSKIVGNTTATPVPRSDWEQTDKLKADFIRHKPDFNGLQDEVSTIGNLVGDTPVSDQIDNAIVTKADAEHTHTYESIVGLEDAIGAVADSKFYVVTFDKGSDGEYHGDLTFAEIREKFEAGGNMVARIDGTDCIPLLSAATHQIIFSGIYQAQSVSLTITASDVCTLTTTQLTRNESFSSHINNKSNPHNVTAEQIGAATHDDVSSAINTRLDEITNYVDEQIAAISEELITVEDIDSICGATIQVATNDSGTF